jgi:hypothetical protein
MNFPFPRKRPIDCPDMTPQEMAIALQEMMARWGIEPIPQTKPKHNAGPQDQPSAGEGG